MTTRNLPSDITWAERIALGKILANNNLNDYDKAQQLLQTLHPNEHFHTYQHIPYARQIADAIIFWAKKEADELTLPPTDDERRAGIEQLSAQLGETAAIISVAKAYSKSPDEVLQWPYPTIFMHLKVETEQERFSRKLLKLK